MKYILVRKNGNMSYSVTPKCDKQSASTVIKPAAVALSGRMVTRTPSLVEIVLRNPLNDLPGDGPISFDLLMDDFYKDFDIRQLPDINKKKIY